MAILLGLFLLFMGTNVIGSPNIICRSGWDARPSTDNQKLSIKPPPYVVIHHSEGAACSTFETCKSVVKGIQNYHMSKNWGDIGYSFLVGGDGNVYEGRGWNGKGIHSPPYNSKSIGICLLGNFTGVVPPSKQTRAAKDLIAYGVRNNFISKNYKLLGHRQAQNTDCPGDKLFKSIKSWRNFLKN